MNRWQVDVVRIRARDVRRGDVVAKDASRPDGWFVVADVVTLPDGSINVLDKKNARAFTTGAFDLVGLQTPSPIVIPPEVGGDA